MEHDRRDEVIDYVQLWSEKTDISMRQFIDWIGISESKFYNWKNRYGKVNEHNGWIPRDFWLEEWEKEAIIEYYQGHPTEGYRRLTYMMMDADVVAVSPSSVWRVLHYAGLLKRWNETPSGKGKGFHQPGHAHDHWHVDVSYLNISSTFYYMCSILDGYSRHIVHWDIKESMKTTDVEIILQKAREKYPEAAPRIITDNGPQFISRDFKEFLRISGMKHVRCSPYYPQSNGKIERYHRSVKSECIRKKTPLSLKEAQRIVGAYVDHYNNERLHSSIGYIAPKDKLEGREQEIFIERDRKLEQAREMRKQRRQMSRINNQKKERDQKQHLIMAMD